MTEFEPVVVVHGGAGTMNPDLHEAALAGVQRAVTAALACLSDDLPNTGGQRLDECVDAAVAAVRVLEDDPAFNAGHGACMDAAGELEVDAGIMRSRDLASGAVAGVRDLADACLVARAVMEHSKHALLVGEGARRFALGHGVGRFGRSLLWTAKAQASWDDVRRGIRSADNRADTVGAVVRDRRGDFCALGSTGGVLCKLPGRVGDTPLKSEPPTVNPFNST